MTTATSHQPPAMPSDDPSRVIHALILDTGPLIKNDPPVNALRARAAELYTTPAVLAEIRDAETRARIETTLLPFLCVRNPRPESILIVGEVARKTGDLGVLSRTDLHVVALAYEIAVERGSIPVGAPVVVPTIQQFGATKPQPSAPASPSQLEQSRQFEQQEKPEQPEVSTETVADDDEWTTVPAKKNSSRTKKQQRSSTSEPAMEAPLEATQAAEPETAAAAESDALDAELVPVAAEKDVVTQELDDRESDNDADWITPENLADHQTRDAIGADTSPVQADPVDTALLTSDYAMQNVALRANLAVVSPKLARITVLKTWVLRCHGCFTICRDMRRQFCSKCGQPTLLRASCSTDAEGRFRVHLKKNMQWNNRGNVFSLPKPTHGSSSGKQRSDMTGGGKNGWGKHIILAEDQKEYTRAVAARGREKARDMMDEDYLPGIVTGERYGSGEKIRIGVGRGVNSTSARH